MNKKSVIALIVVSLLVVGTGITYAALRQDQQSANNSAMMKKEADEAKMKHDAESDKMAKENSDSTKNGDAMMTKGSFSDYAVAKLVNAEKGNVVLFFSASWCPTCKEANKNFNASTPPDDLTLLKVDYDSSNDLKKKYGIKKMSSEFLYVFIFQFLQQE